MKLAIMQPYFMPYIGYWQLIKAVDIYVVYDDVNYINRGWINRNRILINDKEYLFTVALKNASQNKLINEIEILDDFSKIKKQIDFAYKKAPYYSNSIDLLNRIFNYSNKNLAEFIFNSIKEVCAYIGVKSKLIKSSNLNKNNSLHAGEKILDICRVLNATEYYNAIGGQSLYDKTDFQNNRVNLKFLKPELTPYKQFKNDFVAGLSMIDVLMFNSVDEINMMLDKYELI